MSAAVTALPAFFEPDPRVPAGASGVADGLDLARRSAAVARSLAQDPWTYLRFLATLGTRDLTAARAAEPP